MKEKRKKRKEGKQTFGLYISEVSVTVVTGWEGTVCFSAPVAASYLKPCLKRKKSNINNLNLLLHYTFVYHLISYLGVINPSLCICVVFTEPEKDLSCSCSTKTLKNHSSPLS